jgi:ATP-dependent RNA helicase DDX18/HAS1
MDKSAKAKDKVKKKAVKQDAEEEEEPEEMQDEAPVVSKKKKSDGASADQENSHAAAQSGKQAGKRKKEGEDNEDEDDDSEGAKKSKSKDAAMLKDSKASAEITHGGGILSDKRFDSLEICQETMNGIKDLGFETMTLIQSKTIMPLLAGRDVLAQVRHILTPIHCTNGIRVGPSRPRIISAL